jgi:dihydroxy-acid dehydratase
VAAHGKTTADLDEKDADIANRRARAGLDDFDRIGREVPVLVDLKPSGDHYMEHFHWAGRRAAPTARDP